MDEKKVKKSLSGVTFVGLFFALLFALILVHLWTRAFDLIIFQNLGIPKDSASWAVIVAVFMTISFLLIIWLFNNYGLGSVENVIVSGAAV